MRRYVDVSWGQAHVAIEGDGPPVVFVHSLPRSGEEFRGVLGRLPGRACIAVDLPGLGASDPLGEPISIERAASAVWEVCDALAVERPAVVGHHGGGVISIEMAASRPDRIEALVLSSTPWIDAAERAARKASGVYYGFAPRDDLSHITDMAERRRPWMPVGRPELWDGVVVDVLRATDPEDYIVALTEYPMEERAALVGCPTLVLARRGDIWFQQRDTLAGAISGALVEVADGTILVEDRPDVLVDALSRFLGP